MIHQLPIIRPGKTTPEIIKWEVGIEYAAEFYSAKNRTFFKRAVLEMGQAFPNMALVVGNNANQVCPPKLVDDAEFPYVFTEAGIKDLLSGRILSKKDLGASYVPMYQGTIPIEVQDRPFYKIHEKSLKENNLVIAYKNKQFLLVPIRMWYMSKHVATSYPSVVAPLNLWKILNIPRDHTMGCTDAWAILCLYPSKRSGADFVYTLQQRVVPRFLIDLLLADIKAVGMWGDFLSWMSAKSTSLHRIFNEIGRNDSRSAQLLDYYKAAIRGK